MGEHQSVCHSRGEYARDEMGTGFVRCMSIRWKVSGRYGLRPHRGISQERLPIYVGFSQFVHNVRQRGKALFHPLVETLVCINPEPE